MSEDGSRLPGEPNHVTKGLELSAPPLDVQRGERAWRLNQWSLANDLIIHAHVMKHPEKPRRPEFRKLLGW